MSNILNNYSPIHNNEYTPRTSLTDFKRQYKLEGYSDFFPNLPFTPLPDIQTNIDHTDINFDSISADNYVNDLQPPFLLEQLAVYIQHEKKDVEMQEKQFSNDNPVRLMNEALDTAYKYFMEKAPEFAEAASKNDLEKMKKLQWVNIGVRWKADESIETTSDSQKIENEEWRYYSFYKPALSEDIRKLKHFEITQGGLDYIYELLASISKGKNITEDDQEKLSLYIVRQRNRWIMRWDKARKSSNEEERKIAEKNGKFFEELRQKIVALKTKEQIKASRVKKHIEKPKKEEKPKRRRFFKRKTSPPVVRA